MNHGPHKKRCPNCRELYFTPDHRQQCCSRGCRNAWIARSSLATRFWSRVEKTQTCWLWTAAKFQGGYGRFRGLDGFIAHRMSWIFAHGPIPDGLLVLHKCDVRSCVNPDHLFLGTQVDNMRDMAAKGRGLHPRGEQVSKITEQQVRQIRRDDRPQSLVASLHGITQTQVSRIKRRTNWAHIG